MKTLVIGMGPVHENGICVERPCASIVCQHPFSIRHFAQKIDGEWHPSPNDRPMLAEDWALLADYERSSITKSFPL